MVNDPAKTKQEIRTRMATAIAGLDSNERKLMDRAVEERVLELFGRYFQFDSTILAYMPLKDEVDITGILTECLELDLCLALPKVEANNMVCLYQVRDFEQDLEKSRLGVMEPISGLPVIPFSRINLALIPGRAFTIGGMRLGRGLGCYDRIMEGISCPTVGIAYSCQIVDRIPAELHDRAVDIVVTDKHPDSA